MRRKCPLFTGLVRLERTQLDPVKLLHCIRESQAALAALVSPETASILERQSLDEFLAQLPRLWRSGEVRPTHRKTIEHPRNWRTRKDPFETTWPDILIWLQEDPDATAKSLFQRLDREHPGHFTNGQLRTLQRRIKEWRQIMAKNLVYACLDKKEHTGEIAAIGVDI